MYYERRPFPVRIHRSDFAGEPRPELDAAWHEQDYGFDVPNVKVYVDDHSTAKSIRADSKIDGSR